MGYPVSFEQGQAPAVRTGRLTRKSTKELTVDCPIMGGDSGGPLLNLAGQVIGIGSRCDDDRHNVNYFVPEEIYREYWSRMLGGEEMAFNRRRETVVNRTSPRRPEWDASVENGSLIATTYPAGPEQVVALRPALDRTANQLSRQAAVSAVANNWSPTMELAVELYAGELRLAAGCRWSYQERSLVVTKASLVESVFVATRCRPS